MTYSNARRGMALLMMAIAFILVGTPSASAHTLHTGPQPTNYRSVLTAFPSPTRDVRLQVLDDGLHLQLTVTGTHTVVVMGYSGRPYLRITPRGAEVNTRSPDYYLNRTTNLGQLPNDADVTGPPRWQTVARHPSVTWHDHRTHYMGYQPPPAVQAHPGNQQLVSAWTIPVRIDGDTVIARGELSWVPGPSPTLHLLFALAAAAMLVIACLQRRWWRFTLSAMAVMAVAVDAVRTVALYDGRSGSVTTRLAGVGGYGLLEVALVAVLVLLLRATARDRPSAAGFALLLAALTLFNRDLPGLSVLWRSQMLTGLSAPVFRALTATALALSVAILTSGIFLLRRLAPLEPPPTPATKELA